MSNTAVVTPRATGVRRPSVKVSRPNTQSFNEIFGPDVYYEIIVVCFKKFKRFFFFFASCFERNNTYVQQKHVILEYDENCFTFSKLLCCRTNAAVFVQRPDVDPPPDYNIVHLN